VAGTGPNGQGHDEEYDPAAWFTCVQVVASSAEQARKIAREAEMDVRHVEAFGEEGERVRPTGGGSAKSRSRGR
jgi:hypothetical protein